MGTVFHVITFDAHRRHRSNVLLNIILLIRSCESVRLSAAGLIYSSEPKLAPGKCEKWTNVSGQEKMDVNLRVNPKLSVHVCVCLKPAAHLELFAPPVHV